MNPLANLASNLFLTVIATSGPASAYPKRVYRNPTDELVRWLDKQHPDQWYIWEFRAEGTGYPDEEVHNRIHHFPFPDHHPPPFAVIPQLVASMRNWLLDESIPDEERNKRVAVIHCKAGKGRTGTMLVSYLMSEEGWGRTRALRQFTKTRMRSGFGKGVTIASQKRYVKYVEKWVKDFGKVYVERPVEILGVRVWGLKDGVQVTIDGFVEQGKKIERVHRFTKDETQRIQPGSEDDKFEKVPSKQKRRSTAPQANEAQDNELHGNSMSKRASTAPSPSRASTSQSFVSVTHTSNLADAFSSLNPFQSSSRTSTSQSCSSSSSSSDDEGSTSSSPSDYDNDGDSDEDSNKPKKPKLKPRNERIQKELRKEREKKLRPAHISRPIRRTQPAYILCPSERIILPTSDVNISMERRVSAAGFTMATSIAHCWFNAYFEGGRENDEGIFGVRWDQMDGIKGTNGRGVKACQGVEIIWRYVTGRKEEEDAIPEEYNEEGMSENERKQKIKKQMAQGKEPKTGGAEGIAFPIDAGEVNLIKEISGRSHVEEVVTVPKPGEEIKESEPANWKGEEPAQQEDEKGLFIKKKGKDKDRKN